jgi:multiple sugar transport system substrate-binding protein
MGCTSSKEADAPGGGDPQTASLAGVELKLIVADDHALAEAARLLRGEWQGATGAKLEIVEQSAAELLAGKNLQADAIIYPAEHLGELAEREWLAPIPKATLDDRQLAWVEIFEADKSRLATWGTAAYAVPFGSPVLCCFYRADLLKEFDRGPPNNWTEYQELVELFAKREKSAGAAADGRAWFAAAEPLAEGWAGLTLLARAASYAKHYNHYSTLFDMESMEPLIAAPPFVRALDELAAAAKHGPNERLDFGPEQVRRAFADGRCALALSWPAAARSREMIAGDETPAATEETATETPFEAGFVELPGSDDVYNLGSKQWDKRRPQDNPRMPLLGVSGRLGSLAKQSAHAEAAGQLLAWLSGPNWGPRVSTASQATTLYRESHLAAPGEWLSAPVEEAVALQYAETVKRAMSHEESLMALRIPGRERYLAALDRAVRKVVAGEAESQGALDEAAAAWNKITAELGLEAQRAAYRRDLGLR